MKIEYAMILPTIDDIHAAAELLKGKAVKTPLIESQLLNQITGARVFLKAECLQRTGSFKFRGAFNALSVLAESGSERNILAMSSGNHAQGVAEAARLLGFNATILMPADAPEIKKMRTRRSGAKIIEYDRYSQNRDEVCANLAQQMNAPVIHPFENFHVIAGQGTTGLEIANTLHARGLILDRALVCAGGGGLMGGILLALTDTFPKVKVHPVEPEGYDDQRQSLEAGELRRVETTRPSVCDAIITPQPGRMAFAIGKDRLSAGLVITDEEALAAVAFAFHELKMVVEPGGAAALAAVLYGKIDICGEVVALTLSGGNIDAEMMQRALTEPSMHTVKAVR